MDSVIPNFESVPERIYTYEEGSIVCKEIDSSLKGSHFLKRKEKIKTKGELFRISLPKKEAEMLMYDLYYGEYTGG